MIPGRGGSTVKNSRRTEELACISHHASAAATNPGGKCRLGDAAGAGGPDGRPPRTAPLSANGPRASRSHNPARASGGLARTWPVPPGGSSPRGPHVAGLPLGEAGGESIDGASPGASGWRGGWFIRSSGRGPTSEPSRFPRSAVEPSHARRERAPSMGAAGPAGAGKEIVNGEGWEVVNGENRVTG